MFFGIFGANRATTIGMELADQYSANFHPSKESRIKKRHRNQSPKEALDDVLRRAKQEIAPLKLNFLRKARLANAFKWRLIENGLERTAADELTQSLVVHLTLSAPTAATNPKDENFNSDKPKSIQDLLARGDAEVAKRSYEDAIRYYEAILAIDSRHVSSINNIGACLCQLGRYHEAEKYFRQAVKIDSRYAEAQSNLGAVLRGEGQLIESETCLRRALKAKPSYTDARISLGLTLLSAGRTDEARGQLEKALRASPSNTDALIGMGKVAVIAGDFTEAEKRFKAALEKNSNLPRAWASLASLRKMTQDDGQWLKRAKELAATGLAPIDESGLRFAIGKYSDDIGDYHEAFKNYERGNELLKTLATPYDRSAHRMFVDDLVSAYSKEKLATYRATGSSSSELPVLVVGMMRSGTSLVEQILASHPKAAGAGELDFWTKAVNRHEMAIRRGTLDAGARSEIARSYPAILSKFSADALRVVDKAPINSDYLGLIHSIFPNARIVYMRRNPIDICLSCYFQEFLPSLNFTMDLADLADYYEQHQRLVAHWTSVVPSASLLTVPYAELVQEPELWIRRILDFVGLDWHDNCLQFQLTKRPVSTASAWQVRQPIYKRSVERWRNYERFLGPLRRLEGL